MTSIQEAKDLKKLPLEELIGSLMTNEITMSGHNDESKKKKNIALKSTILEESDEYDEDSGLEEMSFIIGKFKSFLKKNHGFKNFKHFK